jgi:hypothetical protein
MQTINLAGADAGRQDVIVAKVPVVFGTNVAGADFAGVTGTKTAIAVPAGAIVVGGFYRQVSGTTASVDVNIGDGGVVDRYAGNIDANAAGTTSLTLTGYKYTTDDTIDILVDAALPAAGGTGLLVVQYIVDGRAAFVQK